MMQEEIPLYTREQIYDTIKTMYGGRASEELFLGTITTGAQNDIVRATELAMQYVGSFGMDKEYEHVSVLSDSAGSGRGFSQRNNKVWNDL